MESGLPKECKDPSSNREPCGRGRGCRSGGGRRGGCLRVDGHGGLEEAGVAFQRVVDGDVFEVGVERGGVEEDKAEVGCLRATT